MSLEPELSYNFNAARPKVLLEIVHQVLHNEVCKLFVDPRGLPALSDILGLYPAGKELELFSMSTPRRFRTYHYVFIVTLIKKMEAVF